MSVEPRLSAVLAARPPEAAIELDEREAHPTLCFPAASIAVHLLLRGIPEPEPTGDDRFAYHQRELLSYAHRDTPPLILRSHDPPDGLGSVICRFPEVEYSAGTRKRLPAAPGEHGFELQASVTYFPSSGQSVVTLVLRDPDAGAETLSSANPLTEFGVIRLAKLWEAGEGAPELCAPRPDRRLGGARWVIFHSANGEQLDFAGLIDRVRRELFPGSEYVLRPTRSGGPSDRPYATGSLQLRTDAETTKRLAKELRDLQDPLLDCQDPAELLSLSGVLRALASFDDTHRHELPSIFRDTIAHNRLITTVHKGTFLRIAESMRMPSAYFLLPHTIALHNEALLDVAVETGSSYLDVGHDPAGRRTSVRADHLVDARSAVSSALAQCVDAEAIHYPNLRALYERAAASRGLDGLEARARRYATELQVEADGIRAWQQAVVHSAIAVFALVFAVVQVKDTLPLEIGLPVAVLLAIVSIWLLPVLLSFLRGRRRGQRSRASR